MTATFQELVRRLETFDQDSLSIEQVAQLEYITHRVRVLKAKDIVLDLEEWHKLKAKLQRLVEELES